MVPDVVRLGDPAGDVRSRAEAGPSRRGNDYASRWAAGLLRIEESVLRPPGRQRDGKRRLNTLGQSKILPLGAGDLMRNTLLDLPKNQRRRILNQSSGQQSVNSLFRELIGVLVNRATVLTVAQQDDCLKRVRDARKHLRKEGVVIFGHYPPHPDWAGHLGLPCPRKGQFVSARLVPQVSGTQAAIDDVPCISVVGREWRLERGPTTRSTRRRGCHIRAPTSSGLGHLRCTAVCVRRSLRPDRQARRCRSA